MRWWSSQNSRSSHSPGESNGTLLYPIQQEGSLGVLPALCGQGDHTYSPGLSPVGEYEAVNGMQGEAVGGRA